MDIEWNEWAAVIASIALMVAVWSMFFNDYVDWTPVPLPMRWTITVITWPAMYILSLYMIDR